MDGSINSSMEMTIRGNNHKPAHQPPLRVFHPFQHGKQMTTIFSRVIFKKTKQND